MVSVVRVVAGKALALVEVSSGRALLFSVSVADSFFEVEAGTEVVGTRAGIEIVLESLLVGRLVGAVNDDTKEEINDPFVWTGSGVSVAKVGRFDKMLDKIGTISVGVVLLIGRPVGKTNCKLEVIPDTIGTVTISISEKKQGKINITKNSPYHLPRPKFQ